MDQQKVIKALNKQFKSFSEFESYVEQISDTKLKGDCFELFGKYMFIIKSDTYQIIPDKVYLRDEIPQLLKEKLKLELTDHGVDGAYVQFDGKIVAFQSKFRSHRTSPSYKELATFWTESEYADYRMIVANSYDLPVSTERRKNQMSILAGDLDELDEEFFEEFYNLLNQNPVEVHTTVTPREYQQDIIDAVLGEFETEDRGKLIAACGTGKTLMAKWIHDKIGSKNTLFVAPSIALIKQAIDEWKNNTDQKFIYLAVCSDQSVDTNEEDICELKLNEVSFNVTTNPEEIEKFLLLESDLPKVIFSTYQSIDAVMNGLLNPGLQDIFAFDLALYDEAHRTAGAKNSKMFVYALKDEYIPVKKRLFLTATERNITKKVQKSAKDNGLEIYSMDDITIYGKTFSELNFGTAISQGIIADYRVVVCTINEEDYVDVLKYNNVEIDIDGETKKVRTDMLVKKVILAKAIKELGIQKLVTYHSRVDIARRFTEDKSTDTSIRDVLNQIDPSKEYDNLYLNHVNGAMSAGMRKKVMDEFRDSEYGVLSNAKCLTEGIDVPVIDGVYFADPKYSSIDIVQAIGRALRKKPTEDKVAYILVPIIIPKDVTTFSGLNSDCFETLHEVLQALRDQDKSFADIIDEINYDLMQGTLGSGHRRKRAHESLEKKLIILPFNKLNINNFESSLTFRIAEVNKDGITCGEIISSIGTRGCASDVKNVFTSISAYKVTAFRNLVIPTLELYASERSIKTRAEIEKNNNNVSHTLRLGAIDEVSKNNFSITPLGEYLLDNPEKFISVYQNQIMSYWIINKKTKEFLFPYRAVFKILSRVKKIRKFDFIWCIYTLENTKPETIENAIKNIFFLQETYPYPEKLNQNNKQKVLDVLNVKFDLNIGFNDLWSSRGKVYNQFNYIVKDLLIFENIFELGAEKHTLQVKSGGISYIHSLLRETGKIEELATNGEEVTLLRDYYTWKLK